MSSLLKMNKFEVIDLPGMNTLAFLVDRDYEASGGKNKLKKDICKFKNLFCKIYTAY